MTFAFDHDAIHRDAFTRFDHHHVIDLHGPKRDLNINTILAQCRAIRF